MDHLFSIVHWEATFRKLIQNSYLTHFAYELMCIFKSTMQHYFWYLLFGFGFWSPSSINNYYSLINLEEGGNTADHEF